MDVGKRLRTIRKEKGFTVTEVAELADLSAGFVSQVENGSSNPSLQSLKRIGDALGVAMGDLFSHGSEHQEVDIRDKSSFAAESEVKVVRHNRRKVLEWPGRSAKSYLLTPDLQRQLEVTLTVVEPGSQIAAEAYSHEGEEFGLVLEGRYEVTVADQSYTLEEGDSIYFSSHLPHSSRALGDRPAKTLWVITPPSF